jgi:hypothetical protein
VRATDLRVDHLYYYETSTSDWNNARNRDIDNRYGTHQVRIRDTALYYKTPGTAFLPAGDGRRGTHVQVLIIGSPTSRSASRQRDRLEYISLSAIRAPWDQAVTEAREAIARHDARMAEQRVRRADREADVNRLVERAAQYGLQLDPYMAWGSAPGRGRFTIGEDNLILFLDALDEATRELSTASTGGTE